MHEIDIFLESKQFRVFSRSTYIHRLSETIKVVSITSSSFTDFEVVSREERSGIDWNFKIIYK